MTSTAFTIILYHIFLKFFLKKYDCIFHVSFINKRKKVLLRLVVLVLVLLSIGIFQLGNKYIVKLDNYDNDIKEYFLLKDSLITLQKMVSDSAINVEKIRLTPLLFTDWIQVASWLEIVRNEYTPNAMQYRYQLGQLIYPDTSDSGIAVLPVNISFTVDSSTSTVVISDFIENITEKLSPRLSLETVDIIGDGKGVRKGELKLRGWILNE